MRLAICDDNKRDREFLYEKLQEIFSSRRINVNIDVYENGEELLKSPKRDAYKVYFLDIYMDRVDGIEVAKHIKEHNTEALIVLITTSKQHYADGFEVGAIHYLLKPSSKESIEKAVSRCLKYVTIEEPFLEVMVEREKTKILFSWITCIESENRFCFIQTTKQQYKTYQQLNEIEKDLNDPRFLRCHRSYLVNLDFVRDYHNGLFILADGREIPIKRGDRKKMKLCYEDYWFEKMRTQFGKKV